MIPVIYPSAAAVWLNYIPDLKSDKLTTADLCRIDLPEHFEWNFGQNEITMLKTLFFRYLPVTVMSPSENRKYFDNEIIKTKKYPRALPPESFIRLNQSLYLASPELCFLQAARFLDIYQLILFGTELCGRYIYDDLSPFGQRFRQPVTNSEIIKSFLQKADGCFGHRNASIASNYVLDNVNSRMEAMLAVFSALPFSKGGYILKRPEFNAKLNLSEEGKKITGGKQADLTPAEPPPIYASPGIPQDNFKKSLQFPDKYCILVKLAV